MAQGGCCPIPEDIQGQVRWDSRQPDLVVGNPLAHSKGLELDNLYGLF